MKDIPDIEDILNKIDIIDMRYPQLQEVIYETEDLTLEELREILDSLDSTTPTPKEIN